MIIYINCVCGYIILYVGANEILFGWQQEQFLQIAHTYMYMYMYMYIQYMYIKVSAACDLSGVAVATPM